MPFDPEINNRHSVRLPEYDYTRPGAYFVTLVTIERECMFGVMVGTEMRLSDYGRVAAECWSAIPDHFPHVELGTFVIMPNHVHGILILHEHERGAATMSPPVGAQHVAPLHDTPSHDAPLREQRPHVVPGSLGAIVRAYKSSVTRIIRQKYNDAPQRIWQRNYHEHIIRNAEDHHRITEYILTNPIHWDHDEENIP